MKLGLNKFVTIIWFMLFVLSFHSQFPARNPGFIAVLFLTLLFWVIEKLIGNKWVVTLFQIALAFIYVQGMSPYGVTGIIDILAEDFIAIFYGRFDRVSALFSAVCCVIMAFLLQRIFLKKPGKNAYLIFTILGSAALIGISIYTERPFANLFIILGLYLVADRNVEKRYLTVPWHKVSVTILIVVLIFFIFGWTFDRPLQGIQTVEELVDSFQDTKGATSPNSGHGEIRESGYSTSDEILGYALEMDDTPVLQVTTDEPHYLRGHYRYVYNGRGWSEPPQIESELYFPTSLPISKKEGVEYTVVEGEVEVLSGSYNVLFTPGNTEAIYMDQNPTISISNFRELEINNRLSAGDSYRFVSHIANWDIEFLKKQQFRSDSIPEALQLPEGYENGPVAELTEEVIEGHEGPFNKAKAIESHLRNNYRYSLDVYPPEEGEDLVEEFLFTQEQGYCSHFASAFVVMARLAGIESRWVSGFNSGTLQGDHYIIKRENAHAWPEVYIDNSGWVPFEPTPGFVHHGVAEEEDGSLDDIDIDGQDDLENDDLDREAGHDDDSTDNGDEETKISSIIFWGSVILLISASSIGYYNAKRKDRNKSRELATIVLYNRLLTKLKFCRLGKKNSETPLEYKSRLDKLPGLPQSLLQKITSTFEGVYYGGQKVTDSQYQEIEKGYKNINLFKIIYYRAKKILGFKNRV
ncbi:transglutaminase domain-containing protein [Proteinivorax hydrogeniformans]|uniref:Transglutaminase domain-containing protein n=1 Tax=Proteinivorax hydrogeniformans TaxID=1826727 RepID=A0AAU8HTP6_9FIRM